VISAPRVYLLKFYDKQGSAGRFKKTRVNGVST
jgi:hypothetical protein